MKQAIFLDWRAANSLDQPANQHFHLRFCPTPLSRIVLLIAASLIKEIALASLASSKSCPQYRIINHASEFFPLFKFLSHMSKARKPAFAIVELARFASARDWPAQLHAARSLPVSVFPIPNNNLFSKPLSHFCFTSIVLNLAPIDCSPFLRGPDGYQRPFGLPPRPPSFLCEGPGPAKHRCAA